MRITHVAGAILAAAVLAPVGLTAQEQFEGTITYNAQVMGMTIDVVHYVKPGHVRQEMDIGMGPMVLLIDMGKMEAAMISPAQRTYSMMDLRQFAPGGDGQEPEIVRKGQKETVIGHECEYVDIKSSGGTVNMCVATDMGYYFMGGSAGGGMSPSAGMNEKVEAKIREMFGNGFFPLKMTLVQNGLNVVLEATSFERKAISDDIFVIPEGYMKMGGWDRN